MCGNNKVYNIANCNGVVTNESDIKYGGLNQVIALNKCQDGYFRDLANKFLFYSCSPQGDSGLYYFKLVYPTNQIDIDKATCKKACSVKDLDKIVRTYNIDYNSLLDVPGNSRKDGNYYTQGYKFTANCKTGFLEYREENNDGNIEYIEDKDGLSITCSENGTFSITGSCKSRCDLNDTSLNNNVSVWNKCDENGCNKTSGVIFNYGDILEINSCKDGYFLSNAYSVNTKIKCSDNGSWVLLEQTTEKDGTITTANSCIKKCKVAEIDNYTNIEKFVMNCSTGDTKCNPTVEITGETLLEQGQSIKIESCITNTGFDFIDTANVDEIRKANDMGVICGVTTNPSLIAKEGRDFKKTIEEITTIVDGPISGEVKATTEKAEDMIEEAREIAKIHKNMVVKIPMTAEGLKAVKVLSKEGIKTNVTLIFSANQALLAARAGATYVSPFIGRLDDISMDGLELIRTISDIFATHAIETEIISASVRHPIHVTECALAGADIATVPYSVILQMTKHPLTDQGIEKFKKDYEAVFGK